MVEVCYGSDEAQDLLVSYLEQPVYPKMQFVGKKQVKKDCCEKGWYIGIC